MDDDGKGYRLAFGLRLDRDGRFTDPYGASRRTLAPQQPQQRRRQRSVSASSTVGEGGEESDGTSIDRNKRRKKKSHREEKPNPEVELRINGTINDSLYGHTFVSGFCEGFYGIVVINTSFLSFEERQKGDYLKLFDQYCCGGKKRHVIKF